MKVTLTTETPQESAADTVAVGLFDGEDAPAGVPDAVSELISSGEARGTCKALAVTHAEGKRWLTVGMGKREDFTPERARVAAARALERAREISTRSLCWLAPEHGGNDVVGALVEGTILADYRFEQYKSTSAEGEAKAGKEPPKHLDALIVAAPEADAPRATGARALGK